MLQPWIIRKEIGVGRVGPRIAAFHIVQPKFIQQARNELFVLNGEIHALCLRAIAQCRVEEVKPFFAHNRFPYAGRIFRAAKPLYTFAENAQRTNVRPTVSPVLPPAGS